MPVRGAATTDERGYQFLRDSTGERWRVDGWTPVVAHLTRVRDGYELGLGRNVLRAQLACGGLRDDGFESVRPVDGGESQ